MTAGSAHERPGGRAEPDVTPPGPGTILVIDDEAELRGALGQLFQHLHYCVLEASGGMRGVALAEAEQPDCIVLDLAMPGRHGFDVLATLKSRERTRDIPVIIVSGVEDSTRNIAGAPRGRSRPPAPRTRA
jgi:CheY-like chemotaxis protein